MTVNKLYTSLPANHITAKQTLHLTLKMTTAQVVETSVNSSFQNYTHPDDHTTRTPVNNEDVDESTHERVYNQRKLTNRTAPL